MRLYKGKGHSERKINWRVSFCPSSHGNPIQKIAINPWSSIWKRKRRRRGRGGFYFPKQRKPHSQVSNPPIKNLQMQTGKAHLPPSSKVFKNFLLPEETLQMSSKSVIFVGRSVAKLTDAHTYRERLFSSVGTFLYAFMWEKSRIGACRQQSRRRSAWEEKARTRENCPC